MLTEQNDPLCLSWRDADARLAGAPWHRFVVIGDSLSRGVGDPVPGYEPVGWSDRVADALGRQHRDFEYVNLTAVGATTAEVLHSQVPQLAALRPDLVHVPSGPNDLFRSSLDQSRLDDALAALYERAADTGAVLTCFTLGRAFVVPGLSDWHERKRRLNATVRRLAAQHDAVLVDMESHPVNDRAGLISADGIHFSGIGQAVMAAEVIGALAARMRRRPLAPSAR